MTTGFDALTDGGHHAFREVGDGRYRLAAPAVDGLLPAHDRRLGRAVLLQLHTGSAAVRTAPRAVLTPYPAVAPVLDAGHETRADGSSLAYTVYPASDRTPAVQAVPVLDTVGLAVVAAWLVAADVHLRSTSGTTVALDIDHVVVDPRVVAGVHPAAECPVQWMPPLGSDPADLLPEVLTRIGAGVDRRARRRWAAAVALTVSPHGRRRAARSFAALAGLDPLVLALPVLAPHHAAPGRRAFDRRPLAGHVPAVTRRELTCASVEASS